MNPTATVVAVRHASQPNLPLAYRAVVAGLARAALPRTGRFALPQP
ncbi:MAG: hypothetical protein MUF04_13785 [Akkermansiaceae bacterium]|nr:hypothetical protein [Akkermansiaceae bacterium]